MKNVPSILPVLPALLLPLLMTFWLPTLLQAQGTPNPSFDCAKARATVEILICSDMALARQDATMAGNYKALRALWKGRLRDRLRKDQRRWIKARDEGCRIGSNTVLTSRNRTRFIKCLIGAYQKRNAVLKRRLAHGDAPKRSWREPLTGMVFVKVPGGSFEMGCHANAGWCDKDERPTRTVRLDGFWMGKHEVTQGQWKKIMGSNPSKFKKGDTHPVEMVSWNEVQKFIRRLKSRSSTKLRLPSEAQWEYACRAGGKLVRYGTRSGRMASGAAKYNSQDGTAPVGTYPSNPLGLHDMSGNVYEWVQDQFTLFGNVGTDNPIYESSDPEYYRVSRGGSWSLVPRYLRCTYRGSYGGPQRGNYALGFRLVRLK